MAKKRSEFSKEYMWNTDTLFKSNEECKKELESIDKDSKKLTEFKGRILDNSKTLLEFLELEEDIEKRIEKAYLYAHISLDVETDNPLYQELEGLAMNVYSNIISLTSFVEPELLKSDYSLVEKYIKEEEKLKRFERTLKKLYREKEHILSSKEEQILSDMMKIYDIPESVISSLTDSDMKFGNIIVDGKEVELTESNFSIYLRSNDREVRKQAFGRIYEVYGSYKNTIASTMKGEVEKNVIISKIRKYKDSLNRSLFGNEVPDKVYYSLIDGVHNNLSYLYKYWDLKKNILNLDELHLYDTYTDLVSDSSKSYTFEEAKDLILKIVSPLGDTYKKDLEKAFSEGWIDSCNNEAKRGGAYCTACYSDHPYVLLSYEGKLNDISTLAHELGHAMHYYYAINNQDFNDYDYTIFVAEVASQVNEILLDRYLLDNSNSEEEKLKIIDELLQKYKGSLFRQTMFAEFELFMHKYVEDGGVLTYEVLCNKYYELNKLYFGDNVYVDDSIKYEWERIPHFYMNFYVYQYATSFAASIILANKIYDGDIETRDKYLEFLKLGCTKTPIESLKVAGIDMEDSKVLDDAIKYMDELINKMNEIKGCEEEWQARKITMKY